MRNKSNSLAQILLFMKKVIIPFAGILVLVGLGLTFLNRPATKRVEEQTPISQQPGSPVSYQAGFALFTNGINRSFTAAMYHNLSAEAFIQADNPNIVQVTRQGVTWGDFFDTLPFKLTQDCLITGTKETFCTNEKGALKFYLNGEPVADLLSRQINDGDRALITYGDESEAQIQKQIQQVPKPNN